MELTIVQHEALRLFVHIILSVSQDYSAHLVPLQVEVLDLHGVPQLLHLVQSPEGNSEGALALGLLQLLFPLLLI